MEYVFFNADLMDIIYKMVPQNWLLRLVCKDWSHYKNTPVNIYEIINFNSANLFKFVTELFSPKKYTYQNCFNNVILSGNIDMLHVAIATKCPYSLNIPTQIIKTKNEELIKYMCDKRFSITTNLFKEAVKTNNLNICKMLYVENYDEPLKYNITSANFKFLNWIKQMNLDNYTIIESATRNNCAQLIKWLILKKFSFNRNVINYAVHNIDLSKFLYAKGCIISKDTIYNAIVVNNLEVLQWLHSIQSDIYLELSPAIMNQNLDIINWIYNNNGEFIKNQDFIAAISIENIEILDWLHNKSPMRYFSDAYLTFAIENNKIHAFKWLISNNYTMPTSITQCLVLYRRYDMLNWLHTEYSNQLDEYCLPALVILENFDAIKTLISCGCIMRSMPHFTKITNKHIEILKWLKAGNYVSDDCKLIDIDTLLNNDTNSLIYLISEWSLIERSIILDIISSKNMELILWGHKNNLYKNDNINRAVLNDDLELTKWFVDKGYRPTCNTILFAILQKSWPILSYLLSLGNNLTNNDIFSLVHNKCYHILKILQNLTFSIELKNCNHMNLLNEALCNTDYYIIKYLLKNRYTTFNVKHLEYIAEQGHIKILKLFKNYNIPATIIDIAVKNRHYKIADWYKDKIDRNYLYCS